MGQPYIGEIRMFGFSFPPVGWANCNGALMPISENDALFTLIGTTYGGDGQSTFALPNLESRIPLHQGTSPGGNTYQMGETAGVEEVTLTVNQIPIHSHTAVGTSVAGNSSSPTNNVWAPNADTGIVQFTPGANTTGNMGNGSVGPAGGSQPHENQMPYLAINFCISLFGIFPTQT